MKHYEKVSFRLINFVSKYLPDKPQIELEQIRYGIEVTIVNLIKLPIILILAYILGVFNYVLITMLSFSLIRTFAAGIHAKKSLTCLLFTFFIYFGIVYVSKYTNLSAQLRNIFFIISVILVLAYAPADTEEKPYISKVLRKNLKIASVVMSIIMIGISISQVSKTISNIFTISLLVESILITPFVYKLFNRRYRNYEYY